MLIRLAVEADLQSIADIYNGGIRTRKATFDVNERTVSEIRPWLEDTAHPLLIAEKDGVVLGWVHASSYRTRACYSGVAEFSIYIEERARGQGVGDALMKAFILTCEAKGIWKILSRIFPENTASRNLCQRHGFREVGTYEKHAKLEGVWKDVVIVERLIESNLI
ncbi:MAG: arsinothricin resistance N-acetyltransferase ArsN1 family A [Trueperaceae bacterium]